MSRSRSVTSSVRRMSCFCRACVRLIKLYVFGSEPSSFRQRCTFIWFSSSSLSARTLVRSCSSSRDSATTSCLSRSSLPSEARST
eukprot:scaffold20268_cov111-Isochrysis_galbana.AAC.11